MSKPIVEMMGGSLFALLVSSLFLAPEAGAETHSVLVGQSGMSFSPNSITIAPGDTIEWTWFSPPPPYPAFHTVTAGTPTQPTPNVFDSGVHTAPYVFSRTFSTAGSFPYYCQVHGAMMRGTVVVPPLHPALWETSRRGFVF